MKKLKIEMKRKFITGGIAFLLLVNLLLPGCNAAKSGSDKIDRFTLVNRHNIIISDFDSLNSLSVGNGKFALTVDATGLQTFPEIYDNGVCLGTQSEWGWHSFPNTQNFRLEETFQYFDVEGRQVPYAIQTKEPGRPQDAANYFRVNPHRLHLGMIGLELLNQDSSLTAATEISGINQELNVWKGLISSSFQIEKDSFNVLTCCHPERDLIGIQLKTDRIKKGLAGIRFRFPYPTGNFADNATNWNQAGKHHSEIIQNDANSAVFIHSIDTTKYYIKINWSGEAKLLEKEPHFFVLMPDSENTQISVSMEFCEKNIFEEPLIFNQINELSETNWKDFWETGGAVDFSETADPRAFELERRVVLSRYLTRIQCAGNYPPQETGLTFNSWYGKHHLEMHWWHGVHWAYWGNTEILEKSMQYYDDIFLKAEEKAKRQGYPGVRWPKMTNLQGNDSPSGVGEFLIWQQPHPIYYAELLYREKPDKETLEKYALLIFATADFMAGFARWDDLNNRYILGPPLIPAQESLEKEKTFNPPFELAYWHWGLTVAQKWRERMGMPVNKEWQKVIDGLPGFAQKDGLYLAAESAPDSYENEHYYSDHPMVLGAFGMMPGTVEMDTAIMSATFDHIEKIWNWPRTWGWDYPMAAMSATRLGKPEKAIDLLLKDVPKNTYLKNGHNWQDGRLRIYLPGNGGLLTAVAMMCAGFDGNTTPNPGFPKEWKVKWENLQPVF
jgi:hypothetical protein